MAEQRGNLAIGTRDVVAHVQELLLALSQHHTLDPLKELFWSALHYHRANEALSRSHWPASTARLLAEDPLLLATGYGDFPIIYSRLTSDQLKTDHERPVVTQLMHRHSDGLFIFSDQFQRLWHFVNVKNADKNAKRRTFRRVTIGPAVRLRTAAERLAMLDLASIHAETRQVVVEQHEKAFDVEAVTRKFFDDYRILFNILQKDLWQQTNDNRWSHDYALQLLNRCMFLYFIQRKGWLGNDNEFLRTFWESYRQSAHENDSFFRQWLHVLFFEAFNNQLHGDHTHFPPQIHAVLSMAPHLNGGLFTPNSLDSIGYSFTILDTRFEQVFRFLEGYNFTLAENGPLDQEVAVDPEMIGRVYESLVNISERDERGDAGIFYTPRTEIDLMCRLSLVDYLAHFIEKRHKGALYDTIFALEPEEKAVADDALQALGLWDRLYEPLRAVTVVDPACGSGAFLIGMLHVLADLQERADTYQQRAERESAYTRKKRITGQSLYGVDAMEWAAHIAELRLWLALLVDVGDISLEELHARRDPLLPYLTFKIRHGDSLVQQIGSLNFGYRQTLKGISGALKRRLETLKRQKRAFYDYEPSCYRSREEAMEDEKRLFHDMLQERKIGVEKQLLEPDNRPAQLALMSDTAARNTFAARQKHLAELEMEKQHLEEALNALALRQQPPFVWDISFAEIFSGTNGGFDIVIGNPPYVRQEQISNPTLARDEVNRNSKQVYKKLLADTVYNEFKAFFQFNPGTGRSGHPVDARSDLYIYFYLHGLRLLNPGGSFCFITSNSWLDVGYGAALQEFLLKHCQIKLILDDQVKRSFASADVNTIIALFSAPDEKPNEETLNNMARFVMLKIDFGQALTADIFRGIEQAHERRSTLEYRVYPVQQKTLLEEGYIRQHTGEADSASSGKSTGDALIKEEQASYSSNKWGGKYLRAPDIYWTILEKGYGKLVRLGAIAEVRRGITTGANEFFYLDEAKIRQWGIEEEFLKPIVKSPRECKSILIDPTGLKTSIFLCHKSKEELRGAAALTYIQWGEAQGYQNRPSTKGRLRWWSVAPESANSIFVKEGNDTSAVFYNPPGCIVDCRLYYANLPLATLLYLNSVIGALLFEIYNRAGLGEGARSMMVSDYSLVPVLNNARETQAHLEYTLRSIYALPPRKLARDTVSKGAWAEVDAIVFDTLGLTAAERESVYEATVELVEARLRKASSLNTMLSPAQSQHLSPEYLRQ